MKNIVAHGVFIVALSTIIFSCSPAKKIIGSAISPKDSLVVIKDAENKEGENLADSVRQKLQENYIDFKTFSAKIKVETKDENGTNPDITAVVRMVKDSAIWISLSATFLNVEVYRLYVTPDSIILLNKREKEVQYRKVDYLQEVTQIPFDFSTLQNLLVGNPVFFNAPKATFLRGGDYILASDIGEYFKNLLTINSSNFTIQHSKLDDVTIVRHRTADLTYADYIKVDDKNFSTDRRLTIAEKNKIEVHMNFKQVEFNKDLQLNFSVPKNYKIK